MPRRPQTFVQEIWHKYRQDNVSILVSSLAYFTFFSFFPILLLLVSATGFLFGMGEEYARLPRRVLEFLPVSSDYLSSAVDRIVHARRSLGLFGTVLLIWSSTAAFDVLQQILNKIHQAPTMRPLWRRRLLGLLLGLILLLFVPLSFGIAELRPLLARALAHDASLSPRWESALATLCSVALGITFNFLLFLTLYSFGPSVRRGVRQTWAGALAGGVLWEATKTLFRVYIHSLSSYKMLYGSIGSIIAVLLWIYTWGRLFALGAELNFVLDVRRAGRAAPRAG